MENERSHSIAELLRRVTQGEALSEEDTALLTRWRSEHGRNEELFIRLQNPQELGAALYQMDQTDTQARLNEFKGRIRQKKRLSRLYQVASIAATLLVALSLLLYFLIPARNDTATEQSQFVSEYGDDALPASNKATLTLSDGKIIELREDQQGVIADEHGITYQDGKHIEEVTEVQYATLSTPRGGQYQITLSDGSKVSLNAGSSLEYPVQFEGNERTVTLNGEAFFEVVHNSTQPFIVRTEQQQVKVLGTVFNIHAYDTRETTTLISGSVSVANAVTSDKTTLVPNTQAIVNNGKIITKTVDASDYTGWIEGRFQADLITLGALAEELERWYDVQFVYPSGYRNTEKALISINRHEKLSKVLKTLELTYGVQFRIEGKEVHIK